MKIRKNALAAVLGVAVLVPAALARAQTPAPGPDFGPEETERFVSGFVGPVWGQDVDGARVDLGGAVTFLWDQSIGGELAVSVVPSFEHANPSISEGTLSTYMANVIWALPLEPDGRLRPFATAGLGMVRIGGDIELFDQVEEFSETQLATNIGAGLLYFLDDRWGVRTDVRYFWGLEGRDDDEGDAANTPEDVLDGLDFLRWTAGVTYRW